jgi:hypothetical protein
MKSIPYRAAVGRLLHISNITRPDIATAVGIVARFSANPGMAHWTAVKRILRYLKSSSKLGLTLGSPQVNPTLVGYADADHAGNLDSRRSTSGYFFFFGSSPISWCSKGQAVVALSSTIAEYYALCEAIKETVWLRSLFADLGYPTSEPTLIYEDNQSTIEFCYNNRLTSRTKHVATREAFVHEHIILHDTIRLQYLPSAEMIADTLTKPLPAPAFLKLRPAMGLSELAD